MTINSEDFDSVELATNSLSDSTVRGALKVVVDTSKSIIRAGEPFSVFVSIENPFDIPIIILSTQTHLPIELRDLFGDFLKSADEKQTRNQQLEKIESSWGRYSQNAKFVINNLFRSFNTNLVPQIAQAYSTKEGSLNLRATEAPQTIFIQGDTNRVTQWASDLTLTLDASVDPDLFEKYVHAISAVQKALPNKDEVVLRPGSSIVQQFLFKTRSWLFFIPFRHKMIIQVQYIADNTLNYDTVPYDLDIRASLGSTIIGSIIGGFLGSLTRSPDIAAWLTAPVLFPAIISSILAIITVVAFARKSDAQPLIAIEDFLGGLLLGFVVGYTGNALFEQVIGSSFA